MLNTSDHSWTTHSVICDSLIARSLWGGGGKVFFFSSLVERRDRECFVSCVTATSSHDPPYKLQGGAKDHS